MTSSHPITERIPWWRHLSFPLLVKELTEQANRRRTYVVRFLYAAVLFALGVLAISGDASGNVRLGAGQEIFHNLVQLQFWLILIFLPATASGALTIEKERDTLSLLLITTIPPWSIVLQKFLSRLLPMLSFLLLGFPLLAVAYSYGGVGTTELLAAIGLLMLFAVQVAAVAVFCSVFSRTTGEAFISTYLVLAGMAAFDIWPMTQFATLSSGAIGIALARARIRILMTLGASAICLLLGSLLLERRAFLPPRNLLLQLFRRLDRFYEGMNQVTGGIVLVNDGNELPEEKPIAWRETSKKSLGTVRYLFRVLTVLEVSILCVAAWVNLNTVSQRNEMSQLLFILWVVSATMLCVHASGVIASERSHQTLDPLLTTPLTGADILLQKLAGVRRLIFVLLISFASIYGFQTWFQGFDFGYALVSFASAVIFLWLIAWGALWIGLRLNSPMKAVLTSMIAVVLVCAVPLVLESLLGRISVLDELSIPQIISNVSPVRIIQGIEAEGRFRFIRDNRLFFVNRGYITYLVLSGLLLIYGLLLWLIRSNCLKNADVLLQRIPEDSNAPINPMTAKGAATSDHISDAEQLASASV